MNDFLEQKTLIFEFCREKTRLFLVGRLKTQYI